ncbi:MAG: hypothetical protein VYB88_03395 [Pseudomonadota bacterium]|uniref:hypothetical protein n=1 Tax=Ralstonia pickettii TaxID=329 RepID=UPI0027147EF5|nr:hypothetical protein [Ralstonia pickettii]MEE2976494.1 hypothetical protein [Pseudomonadota bacterium]WKZ86382.1 hypothetical protein N5B55_05350 [Ralstonia pickettii]
MDEEQFKKARATMPWTHQVLPTNRGGLVQVLDNKGQEVPIFTMIALLEVVTRKLATQEPAAEEAA